MGKWNFRYLDLRGLWTSEEQLPFEEMKRKKLMATHENIARYSGSVWLHTGTRGNKNGEKLTTGRHSSCIKG